MNVRIRKILKFLWRNIYIYCLIQIIIIHMITIAILNAIAQPNHPSIAEIILLTIALILKWGIVLIQFKILYKYIFLTDVKPIFCLYLSTIIAFTHIYLFMFKINSSQFHIPTDFNIHKNSSYSKLTMVFLSYSISCQTLTGISSINPKTVSAEFLTAIQVLIFGVGYCIFILSIAVLRFLEPDEKEINAIFRSKIPVSRTSIHGLAAFRSRIPARVRYATLPTNLPSNVYLEENDDVLTKSVPLKPQKHRALSALSAFPRTPIKSDKSDDNLSSKSFDETSKILKPNTPLLQHSSCDFSSTYLKPGKSAENNNKTSRMHTPVLRRALTDLTSFVYHPKRCSDADSVETTELMEAPKNSPVSNSNKDSFTCSPNNSDKCYSLSLSLFPDLDALESHKIIDHKMRKKLFEFYHWMVYVKWIYNHMMLVLFGTQIPRLIAMYFACPHLDCNKNGLLIIGIILDILLMAFCLFCVVVRISLIQTFGIHVNITLKSVFHAYWTIFVLFGILEFDFWLITMDMGSNRAFSVNTDDIHKFWTMFAHFIFYSLSTFTSVGEGGNISETGDIGKILNNFEMLVGILFNVVVFGVGLLYIGEQRVIATENFVNQSNIFNTGLSLEEDNIINKGYASIDINSHVPGSSSFLNIGDMRNFALTHRKSYDLRKQGLLPRTITKMLRFARRHNSHTN